ncbi:hypothetical protein Stsp01_06470 [Streptomyces sp. NBRC 13847]|nr:hypothetical protein Stsp01_06470 [Streptomyces sp. NBRC 13847]
MTCGKIATRLAPARPLPRRRHTEAPQAHPDGALQGPRGKVRSPLLHRDVAPPDSRTGDRESELCDEPNRLSASVTWLTVTDSNGRPGGARVSGPGAKFTRDQVSERKHDPHKGRSGPLHPQGTVRRAYAPKTDDEVFLEPEEYALLRAHLRADAVDIVDAQVSTGLRWGEVTALQPRDFTSVSKRSTLRVQRAWKRRGEGRTFLGAPKTKKPRRTLASRLIRFSCSSGAAWARTRQTSSSGSHQVGRGSGVRTGARGGFGGVCHAPPTPS